MRNHTVTASGTTRQRGPGRPREFDLDQALDRAIGVFRRRGYHAASIGELTQAMGVTEGSLYKAFKDKETLFERALERYVAIRQAGLEQVLQSGKTGREQLEAALDYYVDSAFGKEGRDGCLIVGSTSVLGLFTEGVGRRVVDALGHSERIVADLIRKGQRDGSIARSVDANATAQLIWCLLLGIRVAGKTGRSRRDLRSVTQRAMQLLG